MRNFLLSIFLFILPAVSFGQTDVSAPQVDTVYLQGIINGQNKLFKMTEILALSGGGGSGDGLGQPHQATSSLNMDNNEIDSISILNLFDTNGDGTFWAFYEDGATGNLEIKSSDSGAADITVTPSGELTYGGVTYPTATGSPGTYLGISTSGNADWSTPAGGGGGGGTADYYYFSARDTSTSAITSATWNDLTWDTQLQSDPSYSHTPGSAEIDFDSAGTYDILVILQVDLNNRLDGYVNISIDEGAGYPTNGTVMGQIPIHFDSTPDFPDIVQTIGWTHTATDTDDKVKVQFYPTNTGFTWGNSTIRIIRTQ